MKNENLIAWLSDPRAKLLLGRAAFLKLDIIAALLEKRLNVSNLAKAHGISRKVAHQHLARVREIYGFPKTRLKAKGESEKVTSVD